MPREARDWGWRIDVDLLNQKFGQQPPPEGHPRRCQSRNKYKLQCGRWALKDNIYCITHARRTKNGTRERRGMRSFYQRVAGSKLKERIAGMLTDQRSESDHLSLSGEVDVARATVEDALQLFEAAHFGPKSQEVDEATRLSATRLLREGIKFVADTVKAAAQARALTESVVDVDRIGFITEQVLKILEEELGDEHKELISRVSTRLQNIVLPAKRISITVGD